jgi:hypothetical protein
MTPMSMSQTGFYQHSFKFKKVGQIYPTLLPFEKAKF